MHTCLTQSYLLSDEDQLKCYTCQCPITVKQILLEFTEFSDVRHNYFPVSSIKDLFDNVDVRNIVAFIN